MNENIHTNENPLSYQVGGDHYRKYEYQPVTFFSDVQLDFNRANAIKYLVRWKDKGGIEVLKKAVQYLRFAEEEIDKYDRKIKRFVWQFPSHEGRLIEDILNGSLWEAREEIQELIEIEEANIEAEEGDNASNPDT